MNNREYKFRTWDKNFYDDRENPEGRMIYNAQNTYDYDCFNKGGCYEWSFGDVLEDKEKYVTMECVGVPDANNKDIYEGDIVHFIGRLGDYLFLGCDGEIPADGVAMYEQGRYKICFKIVDSKDNGLEICTQDVQDWSVYEVIGNIFENKDKLNDWGCPPEVWKKFM